MGYGAAYVRPGHYICQRTGFRGGSSSHPCNAKGAMKERPPVLNKLILLLSNSTDIIGLTMGDSKTPRKV
jgi:hypothetical protein